MNEQLCQELKQLIITTLNLEDVTVDDIKTEDPLFNEGLGLDSIDALELGLAIKNTYQVKIDAEDPAVRNYFYSVKTLAEFIEQHR